ncbi:ABC transporter permease [Peptococcaceae bacterium 1198_IL3148]
MRQILNIACYEMYHIVRDRILLLMVFLVPLLYAVVLGAVYMTGIISAVPLGIVDLDRSSFSREIVSAFENSPHFAVQQQIETYDQLERAMNDGTVKAGVVIPEDLSAVTAQHRNGKVLTVYDVSNLIWGFNTRKYLMQVVNEVNANHTASYLAGLGYTEQEIQNTLNTVASNVEVWYNPTYSYATYMFPGLLLMIIHQLGLLTTSLSITREKEHNSWLQYLSASVPKGKIFIGKSLPYFIANFFNYGLLIWFATHFIGVKIGGSLGLVVLLGLIFNIIITSLGFFISVLAPNSLQVTRYIMLLSVPMFMISGLTWPQTQIPKVINYLANLLPFTWMANGFRAITLKELGMQYVSTSLLVLTAMAVVALVLALNFSKRRKPPQQPGLTVNCGTSYPRRLGR